MGRIVAIDYGLRRIGIAVTDPLQLIATPLTTVDTNNIWNFLKNYMLQESVEALVVGMPKYLNNTTSPMTTTVTKFIQRLRKVFPHLRILAHDERYTSKMAAASMVQGGFKKKDRRDKANLDKLSATIILQSFLTSSPQQS